MDISANTCPLFYSAHCPETDREKDCYTYYGINVTFNTYLPT